MVAYNVRRPTLDSLGIVWHLERRGEFADVGWKLSQDVIWEKANGTGFAADRFKRVHESVVHWYRGDWDGVCHETPKTAYTGRDKGRWRRNPPPVHTGEIGAYAYEDDGTRLARSGQFAPSAHGGLHPTEKPLPLLRMLIAYAWPPGGLVLDPFAGSGSTLDAARLSGRRAVGVEAREDYAEKAARRLSQGILEAS